MDVWLVLFVSAAFVSAAGITFSVGHLITSRNRLQRRLPAGATMSDALALTSPDTRRSGGRAVSRRSIWPWSETEQRAAAKTGARGLFQPPRCPVLRSCTHRRGHCDAVAGFAVQRAPVARSLDFEVCVGCGGLCRGWGSGARRLSVAPSVLANLGISPEFPRPPGPVDCVRHRRSHRGGVIRENPGPTRASEAERLVITSN